MSLWLQTRLAGRPWEPQCRRTGDEGNGPAVVEVGHTRGERVRVEVQPSGRYVVSIVNDGGEPVGWLRMYLPVAWGRGARMLRRRRISGELERR